MALQVELGLNVEVPQFCEPADGGDRGSCCRCPWTQGSIESDRTQAAGRGEPGSQEKSDGFLVVLWGSREARMPGAWNSAVRPWRRERMQATERGRGTERFPAVMCLLDFCLVAGYD